MLVADIRRRLIGGSSEVANQPAPPPRDVLRAAQQQAAQAAQAAQQAGAAAARGLAGVEAARARLAAFDGLGGRVAEHLAAAARQGIPAGPAALPAPLAAARRAKADADEQLVDAASAHALLAAEAGQAQAAADMAITALRSAADAVMQEVAGDLVADMREGEVRIGRQRAFITALLGSRTSMDAALPWSLSSLPHEPHHAAMTGLVKSDHGADRAAWAAYRQALVADADAILPATS